MVHSVCVMVRVCGKFEFPRRIEIRLLLLASGSWAALSRLALHSSAVYRVTYFRFSFNYTTNNNRGGGRYRVT